MRPWVGVLLVLCLGCAGRREDVTPNIAISPGAKGRLLVMDRMRHHGDVKKWFPQVTVEEVDESEIPDADADAEADVDAGAPLE